MLLRDLTFYLSFLLKQGVYVVKLAFNDSNHPHYNQIMSLFVKVGKEGATIKTYSDLYKEADIDDIMTIVEVKPVVDSWSML